MAEWIVSGIIAALLVAFLPIEKEYVVLCVAAGALFFICLIEVLG